MEEIKNSNSDNLYGDNFKIKDFYETIKRRRNIALFSGSLFFILVCAYTTYQRIFNPFFTGTFTLLISDPLERDKTNSILGDTAYQDLALNVTNNDLPTLRVMLGSPKLVNPIAEKYSVPLGRFMKNLVIDSPGAPYNTAKGILIVSFTGSSPVEVKSILEDLSEKYLDTVLEQRQQRIADGLNFLNIQAPSLQAKTESIQSELSEFRKKNNILEPSVEGTNLKKQMDNLNQEIVILESNKVKLEFIKESIKKGEISLLGFQDAIYGDSGLNVILNDSEQALINELLAVKSQLAKVKSKYKEDSSMVLGLQKRLDVLEPLLKNSQIEAINSAISLNNGNLDTALKQRKQLTEKFAIQPDLIKEYENLNQKLTISQRNLTGLVSAKETFQLEMAQSTVPWKILAEPVVNPIPIKPSIPKNLFLAVAGSLVFGALSALGKPISGIANAWTLIKLIQD